MEAETQVQLEQPQAHDSPVKFEIWYDPTGPLEEFGIRTMRVRLIVNGNEMPLTLGCPGPTLIAAYEVAFREPHFRVDGSKSPRFFHQLVQTVVSRVMEQRDSNPIKSGDVWTYGLTEHEDDTDPPHMFPAAQTKAHRISVRPTDDSEWLAERVRIEKRVKEQAPKVSNLSRVITAVRAHINSGGTVVVSGYANALLREIHEDLMGGGFLHDRVHAVDAWKTRSLSGRTVLLVQEGGAMLSRYSDLRKRISENGAVLVVSARD